MDENKEMDEEEDEISDSDSDEVVLCYSLEM